ncbi:MAG: aminodeoxychorismate/anthranilate synthase component II [Bacteroidaceae bacterium]
MKEILLVDNNDSFVYNLVEYLRPLGHVEVVLSNDLQRDTADAYHTIILSPGAALPNDYPQMMQLIAQCERTHPILGVCLGCQAIASHFGAHIVQMKHPQHGHCSSLNIVKEDAFFNGIPNNTSIGRYHSWVIDPSNVPDTLQVLATDEEGHIMAIKHKTLPLYGLQFHPESIMTEYGRMMLTHFLQCTARGTSNGFFAGD